MIHLGSIGNILAVGATAFAASVIAVAQMDANPTLFLFDKFFATNKLLRKNLTGKNIWIIGASSGIGAELAKQLSESDANLILSSRYSETLDAIASSCRTPSNIVSVVPLDMTGSEEELEVAVQTVQGILGTADTSASKKNRQLDMVVINAGRGHLSPAIDTTQETTHQIFQLNTLGPIAMTALLLKRGLLKSPTGHLVLTSSVAAKMGVPLSASYAASKHALHGYYASLQAECPWMRVDLLCPGPVATNFHNSNKIMTDHKSHDNNQGGTESCRQANPKRKALRELKMPVERCAKLMISSMVMKNGGERWIAEQPVLLGLYINQYLPGLFAKALRKIGPVRMQAWKEGKNLYDPETWKRSRR